jgi:hypothetical protein
LRRVVLSGVCIFAFSPASSPSNVKAERMSTVFFCVFSEQNLMRERYGVAWVPLRSLQENRMAMVPALSS